MDIDTSSYSEVFKIIMLRISLEMIKDVNVRLVAI